MHQKFTHTLRNSCALAVMLLAVQNGQAKTIRPAGNLLALKHYASSSAMQQVITGKVLNEQNHPLPGASVKESGTTNVAMTNDKGEFKITVAKGSKLEISYIGYKSQTITASSNILTVTMEAEANSLGEVMVVGYGNKPKKILQGQLHNLMQAILGKG
jgi:hypothetical protein